MRTTRLGRALLPTAPELREMPAPWRYQVVTEDAEDEWLGRRSQNGNSVTRGRPRITREEVMLRVFDALPKSVRAALADANHDWAPHWARSVLRLGFPEAQVVERLRRADREEALRREVQLLRRQG
jgi:uncharacterized protein DUF6525